MKVCSRCRVKREDSEFINKNGEQRIHCKHCKDWKKNRRIEIKQGVASSREKLRLLRINSFKNGKFICASCKRELVISEFKESNEVPEFGLSSCCRECRNLTYKFSKVKSLYGLEKEELEILYNTQKGLCAICKKEVKFTSVIKDRNNIGNIDHCHTTGKIRGILCNDCNRGLGFFKESPELIKLALEYVVHHKSGELLETPEVDNQQPS